MTNDRKLKREVISVPASKTFELIENTYVYSCSDRYTYDETQYMTCRRRGGYMEKIYSIDNIIKLNPYDDKSLEEIDQKYRMRISEYLKLARDPLKT